MLKKRHAAVTTSVIAFLPAWRCREGLGGKGHCGSCKGAVDAYDSAGIAFVLFTRRQMPLVRRLWHLPGD
jgi:hypothetical protein